MTDFQIDRRWQNLASHFSSLDEFLSWQSRQIQSKKVQQGEALQSSQPVSLNNDRSNAFFQNGHDDGLPLHSPVRLFGPGIRGLMNGVLLSVRGFAIPISSAIGKTIHLLLGCGDSGSSRLWRIWSGW